MGFWHPSDLIGDTMSHGWGSNVLVEIQRELLGVTSNGPGFSTFTVQPPKSGLAHASGRVPTPHGPIAVSWHRTKGGVSLDLTVPANTQATLRLPGAAAGVQVGAGTHHLC